MFTDQTEALEAERLRLTPNRDAQVTAASRTVARRARDKADLAELLDALALPDEDAVTALLPLLLSPTPEAPGDPIMTNIRETTALSMHRDGRTRDEIREATRPSRRRTCRPAARARRLRRPGGGDRGAAGRAGLG
ncbi:hypothetical protein ACFYNY_23995 [Streptomyces sp. NPDC006530]|uniref:hypothetical protein n=1 Tax=Streptomyces sp. NPDC006530 TaxID=3364750 RepID=UPI0036A7C0E1